MTLLVSAPSRYEPERRYILDVVLAEWLGLDYRLEFALGSSVVIRLAGDPDSLEMTLPDILFATPSADWLSRRSMPAVPLPRLGGAGGWLPELGVGAQDGECCGKPLPILFGAREPDGSLTRTGEHGLSISVDVFGSAFFLLARCEEVIQDVEDEHGRFPAVASLAAAEGFLDRPLVDEYVDFLWTSMKRLWPVLVRKPSSFRLRLTHDIDQPWAALGQRPWRVARSVGADLIRRRDPSLAAQRARSLFDARKGRVDRDPLNTFNLLMETSERHGLRSVFYFLAGNTPGDIDFRYQLSDPQFSGVLRRIHERGHEVGLHASYDSFLSEERTRLEFDALIHACSAAGFEQPSWGVRQHYLRFANPQTWRNHESAGLTYDSTLGFADLPGFRAGTCHEYPLFDVLDHRRLELRERPLLVMDGTLFEHLALSLEEATRRIRVIVNASRHHRGDAVLLFHNTTVAGTRQGAHYRELIGALSSDG